MHSLIRSPGGHVLLESSDRPGRLIDMVGAGLFAGYGTWILVAWARSGGSAVPALGLLLACGLALVAARSMGSFARLVVPSAALAAALLVAAGSRTGVFSASPLSGPLEYANADGAFYVQAVIAGLMLAFGAGPRLLRALGGTGALFFAVLPFVIHAMASAALLVVLPAIALGSAALGPRAARLAPALLGVAFVGTVGYSAVSPNALRDPDDRWAHNEFLQQGAEGGVMGLIFLALVFVWGFTRLSAGLSPDAVMLLGAASLAALGIHASVDYVMHFPAIPILSASLVGTGMTDRR